MNALTQIKLGIAIALTLFVLFAQELFTQLLILITGLYLGWRTITLISHGIGCPTCQFKFATALFFFITAIMVQSPRIAWLVVGLVWLDLFLKDKNEGVKSWNAYYG